MSASGRIRRRDPVTVGPGHGGQRLHPLIQRLYAARGVDLDVEAELKLSRLHPPRLLGGLDAAVDLLAAAIAGDRHIVVVGDFDCDGATGTAVAVRGLRMLGARRVGYRVPNRVEHGYGLSPALVADLAPMRPDLLLTVDSGIACLPGVQAARDRGWQVVVSDHHLPGPALPAADAIVNPNLDGDAFPSKALAGVGVVFYLLLALRRRLLGERASQVDIPALLDLVAVGTVADLVPLDYNNRVLVAAGLARIRRGDCVPGIRALAEVAGRPLALMGATDIGFGLAPRLNAAGRLEDMAVGIECLLSDEPGQAGALAASLDRINAERRDIQQRMVDEADALVERLAVDDDGPAPLVCLYDRSWHPGIVGLVASRMKDRLHRPVLAFAPSEPGSATLRGSARSIPGLHIRDALAAVDARHPGLVERFGGHAMAAGLTLAEDALPALQAALAKHVAEVLDPSLLSREILSDGPLHAHEFTRETAEQLRLAGPWGQGFPEPVFDNDFDLVDWRVVGERHLKLRLGCEGIAEPLSAIQFGWDGVVPPRRLRVAYQLDLDDFRGRRSIQLLVRHIQPA